MAEPDSREFANVDKDALWEWSETQGKFVPVHSSLTPYTTVLNTSGNNQVLAPSSGQGISLIWHMVQSKATNGDNAVLVTFKHGPDSSNLTSMWTYELVGSQPQPHRARVDLPVGDKVFVHLDVSGRDIIVNLEHREWDPLT